jgi:RNA polymerase sigma factor (sigma-70 family)
MNYVQTYFTTNVRPTSLRALEQRHSQDAPHPDIALVSACLKGDASAWDRLVEKYGGLVYSLACHYTGSHDEAEDVFQTVFVIVLQSLPQLRKQESLAPWLGTITRRESQRVKQRCKRLVELDENLEDGGPEPIEQSYRMFLRSQVHSALMQLDSFSRDFVLACMADPPPTYQELAKRFDMSVGSIGPTRGRCLKKLKAILSRMGINRLD